MIGASRQVDESWSDFESLTTNVYARTAISGQPTSATALIPSRDKQEVAQTSSETTNASLFSTNYDVKSVTDEMSAIKRSIADLRNHAEEVRELKFEFFFSS